MQIDYDATSPEVFCASLKQAREQKGITLAAISEVTKIAESHFKALECGDLRHWPKGIFCRAFFRDYAVAVGLPVDPSLKAFRRLFPDDTDIGDKKAEGKAKTTEGKAKALPHEDSPPKALPHQTAVPHESLRLTIDTRDVPAVGIFRRMIIALLDATIQSATTARQRLVVRGAETRPAPGATSPRWTTNARRVPGLIPQMRVRIKVMR